MKSAEQALQMLQEGNKRFVAGIRDEDSPHISDLIKVQDRQNPFAIILGCSDSRVPAEIIFDQGMGDLFVIRIAGNIVAPSQLGSIEFAVEQFGTPLVLVLGHSSCGAVSATLEDIRNPAAENSSNVFSIVKRIRPVVENLLKSESTQDRQAVLEAAIKANIMASVKQLQTESPLLQTYIEKKQLLIVGAEYSLTTGEVEFLDTTNSNKR